VSDLQKRQILTSVRTVQASALQKRPHCKSNRTIKAGKLLLISLPSSCPPHVSDVWWDLDHTVWNAVARYVYTIPIGNCSIPIGQRRRLPTQGWNNRTLISHEPLVCSKMCFSKTEPVQNKNQWYNISVTFICKLNYGQNETKIWLLSNLSNCKLTTRHIKNRESTRSWLIGVQLFHQWADFDPPDPMNHVKIFKGSCVCVHVRARVRAVSVSVPYA